MLVGVFVGVSLGVLVGVFVGVLVGVFVGVSLGVLVGVFVGVVVGVGVNVGVIVGVGVCVTQIYVDPTRPVDTPNFEPTPKPKELVWFSFKVITPFTVCCVHQDLRSSILPVM